MSLTREIHAALRTEGSGPTKNKDFHGIKDENPPMKPDKNKFASKRRNSGKFYGETHASAYRDAYNYDAPVAKTRITKDRDTGEFIVLAYDEYGKRIPNSDYYTDDREDAKATAAAMVEDCSSIPEEPGDGSTAADDAKQKEDLSPISEMNPTLHYGAEKTREREVDLAGWECPSCRGPVEPTGEDGVREVGECRSCGTQVSRPLGGNPSAGALYRGGESKDVSMTMSLADRFLKEGCQMEEPEDGHFYGSPKSGNVSSDRNPNFTRKNSDKFFGEHDQMMKGFPSDDGEEGGDGEGEATTDATSKLPAMSKNGMPPTQGGVSDCSQSLGPGGNIKQADNGTGGDLGPEKNESRRPILGRVSDLLREKGEKFPSKPKEFGGKGEGEAKIDKKGDKLKCESDTTPIPDTFEEFLSQQGAS